MFAEILFPVVVFVHWNKLFLGFSLSFHCASLVFLPLLAAALQTLFQKMETAAYQDKEILKLVLFDAEG